MITIRHATPDDNEGLLRLTETCAMQGRISIRTSRRSNFFNLLDLRGDAVLLVAEHQPVGIISSVGLSVYETPLDGQRIRVVYVSDLRIHPSYRGGIVAGRLLGEAAQIARSMRPDLYYCLIAEGNEAVKAVCSGRLGLPKFEDAGFFEVRQLLPRRTRSTLHHTHRIAADHAKLQDLRDVVLKNYSLYPELSADPLSEHSEVLVREDGHGPVASVTLTDVSFAKEYIVDTISQPLATGLALLRPLGKIGLAPKMPGKNSPLKHLWMRQILHTPGHEAAMLSLVNEARIHAHASGTTLIGIGLHERDPLLQLLPRGVVTFRSHALVAGSDKLKRAALQRIPLEDFATI